MFNHVALLGRLAQSPEVKYGEGGVPRATFDLAVQTPSKDHNTPPDYIPIVCWRDQADMAARYLSKGRQIVVEGRIWPDLRLTAGQTAGRPPDKPAADRRQTEK